MDVKIEPTWKQHLADEFDKPYFVALTQKVRAEYGRTTVYPPASEIFSAFNLTPFSAVKVVIIGQDPYHGPGQANGMCFSVRAGIQMPPSLVNIFKEISAETGAPLPPNGDLTRWARQGVLLLNSSLTVVAHQPKSHSNIGWEKFTDRVVHELAEHKSGLVFMLWGADAARKGAFIDRNKHLVLTSPHPSPLSAYRGFLGNNHFTLANNYLLAHNQEPIAW